jgi:hypothetical protein
MTSKGEVAGRHPENQVLRASFVPEATSDARKKTFVVLCMSPCVFFPSGCSLPSELKVDLLASSLVDGYSAQLGTLPCNAASGPALTPAPSGTRKQLLGCASDPLLFLC